MASTMNMVVPTTMNAMAVPQKSNILQPLPQEMNVVARNQNLLKLNVTSARADSTGTENCQSSYDDTKATSSPSVAAAQREKGKPGRKPKAKKEKAPLPPAARKNLDDGGCGPPIKLVKHHHSVKKFQTPSVSRRNARERNRVKQVNSGFATLKEHVPSTKSKTSKVDTLRAAVAYIKSLRELIGDPLDESNLHMGPVLITDLEDHPSNKNKSATSGESVTSTTQCRSLADSEEQQQPQQQQLPHQQQPLMMMLSPLMRSESSQSNSEINPMLYQLPSMPAAAMNFNYVSPGSPAHSSKSSVSSRSSANDIDSTQDPMAGGMDAAPHPSTFNLPEYSVLKNGHSSAEWNNFEGILKCADHYQE